MAFVPYELGSSCPDYNHGASDILRFGFATICNYGTPLMTSEYGNKTHTWLRHAQ